MYLADVDGPLLVAFAAADPLNNIRFLKEYADIHVLNRYDVYRNRSLLGLMRALTFHPVTDWVIDIMELLVKGAPMHPIETGC